MHQYGVNFFKQYQRTKPISSKLSAKPSKINHKNQQSMKNLPNSSTTYKQQLNHFMKNQKARNDPKLQATILKTLLPPKTQQHSTPTSIIYENQDYTHPQDIANKLNDHFTTVGLKTSQTIQLHKIRFQTKLQHFARTTHPRQTTQTHF